MITPFSLARLPRIEFGAGRLALLPQLVTRYGTRVLLISGARSLQATAHWNALLDGLRKHDIDWDLLHVSDEPSPQLVDNAVAQFRDGGFDLVIGIGGGSVLDAAKAIAGLLRIAAIRLWIIWKVSVRRNPIEARRHPLSPSRQRRAPAVRRPKMPY